MTRNVVVIGGAGRMGQRACEALTQLGYDVTVADREAPQLDGVSYEELDLGDEAATERVMQPADVVVNCAGPFYLWQEPVMRAAIRSGTSYVDICDDADATERALLLDHVARSAGVTAVVGAGMSPGIVNTMAVAACGGLERVDELITTWAVEPRGRTGAAGLAHMFHGITGEIPVWEDGRRALIQAYTRESSELFPFPEPVGAVPVRDIGHPETVTLPRAVSASRIRNRGLLFPRKSPEIFELFAHLGLTSTEPLQVGAVRIRPRDVLVEVLTERHNARATSTGGSRMSMGVRVRGTSGEANVERLVGWAAYSSMEDCTSVPVACSVEQLLSGRVPPGVHGPEVLDAPRWAQSVEQLTGDTYAHVEVRDGTNKSPTVVRLSDLYDLFE